MFKDVLVKAVVPSLLTIGFLATGCYAQEASAAPSTMASGNAVSPSTPSSSPADRVILKVGDLKITEAQFEQYIADLEAQQGPAELTRKKLGDNYAALLMLSQQALAHKLESSPEVQRQLAIDRTQILSNAEFAKLKAEAKPTSQQISDYYNAHLDDYDVVTLRRVFIWQKGPNSTHNSDLTPEQAEALAAAIRHAYETGSDPKKVIKNPDNVVIDAEPISFQRGEVPAEMEKLAFAMQKPGEWKEITGQSDAVVLVQLVSRSRRTLSDMTPQIEKKLQSEKLREELDELKKQAGIWMDEGYFSSKAPIPSPGTGPEASGHGK